MRNFGNQKGKRLAFFLIFALNAGKQAESLCVRRLHIWRKNISIAQRQSKLEKSNHDPYLCFKATPGTWRTNTRRDRRNNRMGTITSVDNSTGIDRAADHLPVRWTASKVQTCMKTWAAEIIRRTAKDWNLK